MAAPFAPSAYQKAIFAWAEHGTGSAVVEAVAGSGKTTTLVEVARRLPAGCRAHFLAFNKHAAETLGARIRSAFRDPRSAPACSTFHSLGLRLLQRPGCPAPIVDRQGKKNAEITRRVLGDARDAVYGSGVARLVALAKTVGLVPHDVRELAPHAITPDTDAAWLELIEHHDLHFGQPRSESERTVFRSAAISFARQVLTASIQAAESVVDFNDMLYLPAVRGGLVDVLDFVCIDEAQDTNAVQRAILRRICPPERSESRLLAVGDSAQAVYGWRGSDSRSMALIAEEWRCQRLPLSISYRCPRAVVAIAQFFVSAIQAAPDAPEGLVDEWATWSPRELMPTDVILCRVNAPLVKLAPKLAAARVGFRIEGKDFAEGLHALIRRMRARDLRELLAKLEDYRGREVARAHARGDASAADLVSDRVETIAVVAQALPGDQDSVPGLVAALRVIFSAEDGEARPLLTLSTVHKAKGLEWDRVFLLDRKKRMPSPWAKQPWQIEQESNLIYVAVTRARGSLIDVTSEGFVASAPTAVVEESEAHA